MINSQRTSLYLCIIAMITIWSSYSYSVNFVLSPTSKIHAQISKSGINRISIPPYAIAQVTGDESQYKLRTDNDGQNIYIMPLGKVGSKIELSIKTNIGLVQDIELDVATIPGVNLLIDAHKSNAQTVIIDNSVAVKSMMKAMSEGRRSKYYVRSVSRTIENNLGLKIKQIRTYRFKQLTGVVLELKNITKATKRLDIKDLSSLFDNIQALSIEKNITSVPPRAIIKAFIVTKNEADDE